MKKITHFSANKNIYNVEIRLMNTVVTLYNQWMLEGEYYTDQLPAYQEMVRNLILRLEIENLAATDMIMDLGSGLGFTCRMIRWSNRQVQITAVDPSKKMLAHLRQQTELKINRFLNCTAETISRYCDAPVQVILASFSLHHVPHEQKPDVLRQLYALLPPGGRLGIGEISINTRESDPLQKFEKIVDFYAFGAKYIARVTNSVANGIRELHFFMDLLHGNHEHFLSAAQWRQLFQQTGFSVSRPYFSQPEEIKYFNLIGEKR